VFVIPSFDPFTGYLPAGVHPTPWPEIPPIFGTNSHRARLVAGLLAALVNLAGAGCRIVILDGSFVSKTPLPQDYDAAWEPQGVDPFKLDPVLLDFDNERAAMKAKYGGEFFPASAAAAVGVLYRDFFQKDRNGVPKGVLHIDLGSLP
jgi:hypothetical protein